MFVKSMAMPIMAALAISQALAAPPVPQAPISSFNEIIRLNEEIALLKAKLAKMEVEASIAKKKAEIDAELPSRPNVPLPPPVIQFSPPPTPPQAKEPNEPEELPYIAAIEGMDNRLHAKFVYPGNTTFMAGVGDPILSGWKVVSITVGSVTVRRGDVTRMLLFGSGGGNQRQAGNAPKKMGTYGR